MKRGTTFAIAAGLSIVLASCVGGGPEDIAEITYEPLGVSDCVVWIHGKTDRGTEPLVRDGRGELSPHGNARVGNGLEWQYATEGEYTTARNGVAATIDASGCEQVVLSGFSNGGAFVGKMYCRGESFDGRLRGVVIDDPVPDRAVVECSPNATVSLALYWTGGLDEAAQPGAECAPIGWTCEGDLLLGIDAYARELRTPVLASPFSEHTWNRDTLKVDEWLGR